MDTVKLCSLCGKSQRQIQMEHLDEENEEIENHEFCYGCEVMLRDVNTDRILELKKSNLDTDLYKRIKDCLLE
jgi:hypothetical protein